MRVRYLDGWRSGQAWCGRWNIEWGIFKKFRPGIQFKITSGYLSLGFIYLFVNYDELRNYDSKKLEVYYYEGSIWIFPWIDEDDKVGKPWYRKMIVLHIEEWIKGKVIFTDVQGEMVDIVVPMPEGAYAATAIPFHSTWKHSRWWGKKERVGYDIEIKGCIPFQGKGENGWDCGEDGLCGVHFDGDLEECIGKTIASALRSRNRYGEVPKTRGKVVYA